MSFKSIAQDVSNAPLFVIEQVSEDQLPEPELNGEPISDLLVEEPQSQEPSELVVGDVEQPLEVIEIQFEGLPGAGHVEELPDPDLVVEEAPVEEVKDVSDADLNDAKKSKKSDRWDWESKGPHGFLAWIKERFDTVPKHSGYDTAGLERACSYLEKLDSEISKAMRLDLEEELDANKIEDVRAKIEDGIERLHERLDKIKKSKKKSKKKADVEQESFVKEAQKITGIQGIYIVAPLFASRIARICINGQVSAGHDIEDIYAKQVKKWKLTDREQAEVMQLLADMGYPLRQDRGFMPEEEVDISVDDQFDWAAQFKG